MRSLLLTLLVAFGSVSLALAQSTSSGSSSRAHKQQNTLRRTMISAMVGISPSAIFAGSSQQGPTVQVALQRRLTDRVALGVAVGRATAVGTPFEDHFGVRSTLTKTTTHVGARLRGTFVRSGGLEVYGGLQLGLNINRGTQAHSFPEAMAAENQEAYIAGRTSPFGEDSNQIRPVGFLGTSLELVRGLSLVAEIGNNLSIGQAGLEFQF